MIKNIIFDIGNVLVTWQPELVVRKVLPQYNSVDMTKKIFKSEIWYELNRGKLTEAEAIQYYEKNLNISYAILTHLMQEIRYSLVPIHSSISLIKQLFGKYQLYALTDNVHELVFYLKQKYKFWRYFSGSVISAEVGCLKPSAKIYEELLNNYSLKPDESIFIDDHLPNVDGAIRMGIHGIRFINFNQCVNELKNLGVVCVTV